MPDELISRLMAKLPEVKLESAEFSKDAQSNALETQLLKLSGVAINQEIDGLREVLQNLGKVK